MIAMNKKISITTTTTTKKASNLCKWMTYDMTSNGNTDIQLLRKKEKKNTRPEIWQYCTPGNTLQKSIEFYRSQNASLFVAVTVSRGNKI